MGETSPTNIVLAALDRDSCLTTEFLATTTGLSRKSVVSAVATLIGRGLADRREVGCYTLTAEGESFRAAGGVIKSGPTGPLHQVAARRPRRITQRDRLWSAMRILKKFTLGEILTLAGAGSESNAQHYIAALAGAGYLRQMPRREHGTSLTSNGFKRWQLIRDTGPAAPVWSVGRGELYDPNISGVAR
jgi:predicted transcriptional regulator